MQPNPAIGGAGALLAPIAGKERSRSASRDRMKQSGRPLRGRIEIRRQRVWRRLELGFRGEIVRYGLFDNR